MIMCLECVWVSNHSMCHGENVDSMLAQCEISDPLKVLASFRCLLPDEICYAQDVMGDRLYIVDSLKLTILADIYAQGISTLISVFLC